MQYTLQTKSKIAIAAMSQSCDFFTLLFCVKSAYPGVVPKIIISVYEYQYNTGNYVTLHCIVFSYLYAPSAKSCPNQIFLNQCTL